MPVYFFDTIAAGIVVRDDTGLQIVGRQEIKRHADQAVFSLAFHGKVEKNVDQHFACTVRDEAGAPVYSAGLLFMGRWS